ncbi:MAG: M23 family metallopeptidase [Proteobacteria bacterium]|nr:M23 family metallopeptidase [Pseudomonadota bacterium]
MTGRGWILLVAALALVGAVVVAVPRLEGGEPVIEMVSELVVGAAPREVGIELSDEGAGLRTLEVRLAHAGGEVALLDRRFPGGWLQGGAWGTDRQHLVVRIDAGSLGLADGDAELVVAARDWSWRGAFAGNRSELRIPVRIDTLPPRLDVESGLTYVHRGGSAAVVYRVDPDAAEHGVRVGDAVFHGFSLNGDSSRKLALFAVPVDAPPEPAVYVVAVDAAGNETQASFPARILEREFERATVSLPAGFLTSVVSALASATGVRTDDPVAAFQEINVEIRRRNEDRIREVVRGSGNERYWEGAFSQLPGSVVTSRFAEQRSYRVEGRPVSEARHYGFDLASTRAAPVTAANAGVVLFANDLGIYGNCVILDHGQGLTSLYGHLSRLDVQVGDRVAKDQPLGLSGATGLAGGDHLHFAILVGGTYVDPLEWWDPKWVHSHVETRIGTGE